MMMPCWKKTDSEENREKEDTEGKDTEGKDAGRIAKTKAKVERA